MLHRYIIGTPKKYSQSQNLYAFYGITVIKIGRKTIFLKDWYEQGVVYIHDLLNDAGAWLQFDQFQIKYNIRTNVLRYIGIMNSFKKTVDKYPDLQNLIGEDKPCINFLSDIFFLKDGNALNISRSKSKDFYNCLSCSMFNLPPVLIDGLTSLECQIITSSKA